MKTRVIFIEPGKVPVFKKPMSESYDAIAKLISEVFELYPTADVLLCHISNDEILCVESAKEFLAINEAFKEMEVMSPNEHRTNGALDNFNALVWALACVLLVI